MSSTNQRKFLNSSPIQQRLIGDFQTKFIRLLDSVQPKAILEVGCGEGYLLSELQKRWPHIPLMGIDNDAAVLAEGRRLFPNLRLTTGDAYHLEPPDHSWDVVVASEVLEHLHQANEALAEIKRVTQRYALLSVPHEPWFRLGNLARGRNIRRLGNHPEHVNLWSRKSFIKFVSQQMTVQSVKSAFPWTIILARV